MIDSKTIDRDARASSRDVVGYLTVLLAAACWGSSGVFIKFLVADCGISALALAFWRDLLTFLVLFTGIAVLRPAWLRVQKRDLRWLLGMGVSLGALHVVWNLGVLANGAAAATVQQAAAPAIVAVAAWLIWREPLVWNKILAIVLTFAGTVLVSGLAALGEVTLSPEAMAIGLGIPGMYAAWTLFGKRVRQNCNPVTALTYAFAFAALVLLPLQFFTPQPWPVPASSLVWMAGLITVPTICGFSLFVFALGRLPASVATILAMSEIAFVTVYAYVLLNERLTLSQILGALLVVGGVALLSCSGRRYQTRDTEKCPENSVGEVPHDQPALGGSGTFHKPGPGEHGGNSHEA
jgi:DME family drug/metabolite transporter